MPSAVSAHTDCPTEMVQGLVIWLGTILTELPRALNLIRDSLGQV